MTRGSLCWSSLIALAAVLLLTGGESLAAVRYAGGAGRTFRGPTLGPGPVVFGTITGVIDVCSPRVPRKCRVRNPMVCGTRFGCVNADRVRVREAAGTVTTASVHSGRFSVRVAPGRCRVELLGDGQRARLLVLARRNVTVRRYEVVKVTFMFTDP